ncbi:MAG: hypothetical protein MZU95_00290 [Desulfomicrobium escambiense]|nr:hypothetical protein [Desulfomicrobium escambiense]
MDELADPAQLVEAAVKAARRFVAGQLNLKLRATRHPPRPAAERGREKGAARISPSS